MDDNLTMAVTTNNPAERKAAIRMFGVAGQRPSSTPDPTDRCSGETFSQPNRVPRPLSSGGITNNERSMHFSSGEVGEFEMKRTTNKRSWQE